MHPHLTISNKLLFTLLLNQVRMDQGKLGHMQIYRSEKVFRSLIEKRVNLLSNLREECIVSITDTSPQKTARNNKYKQELKNV